MHPSAAPGDGVRAITEADLPVIEQLSERIYSRSRHRGSPTPPTATSPLVDHPPPMVQPRIERPEQVRISIVTRFARSIAWVVLACRGAEELGELRRGEVRVGSKRMSLWAGTLAGLGLARFLVAPEAGWYKPRGCQAPRATTAGGVASGSSGSASRAGRGR